MPLSAIELGPCSAHAPCPQAFRRDEAAREHRITDGVADGVGGQESVRVDHVGIEGCEFVGAGPWAFSRLCLSLPARRFWGSCRILVEALFPNAI
jgi:hypothetical protein